MKTISYFILLTLLASLVSCKGGGGASEAEGDSPTGSTSGGTSGGASGGGSGGYYSDTTADPYFQYMWHVSNTGQQNFSSSSGTPGMDIRLGSVHNNNRGHFKYIVISDGRIDVDHEDLIDGAETARMKNYAVSMSAGVSPTTNDDTDAHGTIVMGIAGARRGNGKGAFGIAPLAKLIGLNFVDSDQSVSKQVDQASVISWGGFYNYSYGSSNCMVNPVNQTYLNQLITSYPANVYVTSGGNDFDGVASANCGSYGQYLGNSNFDQVKSNHPMIVVAAVNASGVSANYSTPGSNIWISAPGGEDGSGVPLISTDLEGCNAGYASLSSTKDFDKNTSGQNPGCAYAIDENAGTSFAAPIVTGATALISEACTVRCNGRRDIKDILAKTARKINANIGNQGHPAGLNLAGHVYEQDWITNSAGFNFHNWYGFGMLDLTAAIALANTHTLLPPEKYTLLPNYNYFYSSGTVNLSVPDNSSTGRTSVINVNRHNLNIEHVLVRLNVTHPYIGDLGVELTSPSGTVSKLMNINSGVAKVNLSNVTFGSNAFYGEKTLGNWTIKIIDGASGDVGTLTKWDLTFVGHKDPASTITTIEPVSGLTNSGNAFTWVGSTSPNVLRYEACVSFQSVSCDPYQWYPVNPGTSHTATHYSSSSAGWGSISSYQYKLRIRAIDINENESVVVERNWTAP